jgi:hippurate hydrolase
VLKLQTIVSREIAATDSAVVTVGSLHVGTASNVIADDAVLEVNVRSFDQAVRERVLAAVERIVNGEAATAGAPKQPEIERYGSYPITENDEAANNALAEVFLAHFGPEVTMPAPLITGSEDFSEFGRAAGAPSVFWLVGGFDPQTVITAMTEGRFERDIPSNHSPRFAPVLHPTLRTGIETLVAAALSRLAHPGVG